MEKQVKKTIYGEITDAMENGRLPEHFTISYNDSYFKSNQLSMAPGAIDGMFIYHVRQEELPEADREEMFAAIKAASDGNPQAYRMFSGLGRKRRAIDIIDELQKCVQAHADELDQTQLYKFAILNLILDGRDIECVKFGLELLELYGEPDEKVKQIVRNLGLYSEFTIFSVFNMNFWENSNEEIFYLAKNTEGWGRVHAIERLRPETQEIRDWLLYEGNNDGSLSSYNALTCIINSEAAQRLKRRTTDKEYSAIGDLIGSLLQEGPGDGISEMPEAENFLADYVAQADLHNLDIYSYNIILDIFYYASEQDDFPDLISLCRQILTGDACRKCIEAAVQKGRGIKLAIACGIPYQEALLQALKDDFENQYSNCRYLLNEKDYTEKALNVFREHIPPESIEQNPQDEMGLGSEFTKYMQLDFLLQELGDKPFSGIDYVRRTIASPVTRNRTMSMRILKSWVDIYRIPLKDLLPQIYDCLLESRCREVNDDVRASMQQLIDGVTEFPEDERTARNHLDCFEDDRFSNKVWSAPVVYSPSKLIQKLDSFQLIGRRIADINIIGMCFSMTKDRLEEQIIEAQILEEHYLEDPFEYNEAERELKTHFENFDSETNILIYIEVGEPFRIKFADEDVLEIFLQDEKGYQFSMNCIPWEFESVDTQPNVRIDKILDPCIGRTITSIEVYSIKNGKEYVCQLSGDTKEFIDEGPITKVILHLDDGNGLLVEWFNSTCITYVDCNNEIISRPFTDIKLAFTGVADCEK